MINPRHSCNREVGSLKRPRAGVTGLIGVVGAGVAGRMGIGRYECVVVRGPVMFPVEGGVGKKSVLAGSRRQLVWMARARIN